VVELETGDYRPLAGEDEEPDVSWGVAEFIASEEMHRFRGCWWSPDGERIAAARVDDRPLEVWYVAEPSDPGEEPRAVRYPGAGTANSVVSLHVLGMDGSRVDVVWDLDAFPYLARVRWDDRGLLLLVQSRDQRRTQVLLADPATGGTTVLREESDPCWIELIDAEPAFLADGLLVTTVDTDDTRRIALDGLPASPPGLQVRSVVHVAEDVLFTASEDPIETHVWRLAASGEAVRLTQTPGVHAAAAGGDVTVIVSDTPDGTTAEVRRADAHVSTIAGLAERPVIEARPAFFVAGMRELRSALLTPAGAEPDRSLPVLLDPYGGPHAQQVTRGRGKLLVSQWFADHGFAVLVADGRGTPGRGPTWEREIHRDLAGPVLEDQVDALRAAAERFGFLDLSRVAIRGWSFGGYLAVLAVLRQPDVFHAAVAGAPVTDWRLYDTHYTERYLGHPDEEPEAYRNSSLLDDAPNLTRPLLLIHGLADDNVVSAHTLRLSRALLEAGRPHSVLPLSGVTHMTPQEVVAENLLLLQLDFLRRALGLDAAEEG
jgi:dipeptidyl-peptidase-4